MASDERQPGAEPPDDVEAPIKAGLRPWKAAALRLAPAVPRRMLLLVAGLVWAAVAVMLCRLAVLWLRQAPPTSVPWLVGGGVALALLVHHLGFLRIVDRNLSRIRSLNERVCLFGFQPLKSYLILFVMIGMGVALRSSPIPKPYIAPLYVGIGGGIGLSSVRYLRHFARGHRETPPRASTPPR